MDKPALKTDSPCVRNCCLDDGSVCLGCGRKLEEIIEWHTATYPRKQKILVEANQRLSKNPQHY
jgi:uncharacterized protein